MIVSLTMSMLGGGHVDLCPTDLDSHDWLLDHELTYSRICDRWLKRWQGRPILLSDDSSMREMRDDLLAALLETFPRIHFVITATVRRTVTEMVTVR